MESDSGLFAPLRSADFRRLWAAQGISVVGDKLHQIAMAVLVYETTGSAVQMGVMLGITVLPAALFSVWAGALVDRWDRRRTLIACDLLRAALVFGVPFAASASIYAAYVLAFAVATVSLFFEPARLALVPDLLPAEQLMGANSLDNASVSVAELAGLAASGGLVAALGYRAAFMIDAATYLLSAAFVLAVRHRARQLSMQVDEAPHSMALSVAEGLRHIWRQPVLRDLIGVQAFAALAIFGTITLSNLLALDYFKGGSGLLATFDGVVTVGILIGSISVGRSGPNSPGLKFLGGQLALGLACAGIALVPRMVPAFGLLFVSGVANMWFQVPMFTMMQTYASADVRGRVFATRTALTRVAGVVGLVGAGIAAERIGVPSAFGIFGLAVIAVSIVAWTRPALRTA